MARTIVIAASKGGSGKTTTTAALAAYAASIGEQVVVVDADPQQSFGLWHERRGWPQNPACISAGEDRDLGSAIARAQAKNACVIVDLPGSLLRTDMAIRDADLIVIPVRPSMLDIEARQNGEGSCIASSGCSLSSSASASWPPSRTSPSSAPEAMESRRRRWWLLSVRRCGRRCSHWHSRLARPSHTGGVLGRRAAGPRSA
jgi:hypothetical protein